MTRSMTGYAARAGQGAGMSWSWDLRAVNGRGLDLRLRLPDWIEGLEQAVRTALQERFARGNLSLSLRIARDGGGGLTLDRAAFAAAVALVREAEDEAAAGDLSVAPVRATDLLQMRGVVVTETDPSETAALRALLLEDLQPLLDDLDAARRREGAALEELVTERLARIEALVAEARGAADERQEGAAARLRAALDRLREAAGELDEARLMQEVALIATRYDVAEELDRLDAHVSAGRDLIAEPAPKGRKLEFLLQEFNREANTLCSKSQSVALTRTGLELKAVIDQMREQVQNLE